MPLTRRITGREIPKQFCSLFGSTSLLDQTRRRVALAFSEESTVTILTRSHESFYGPLLADAPPASLLVQPSNRGTAPAILHGLVRFAERNPEATIGVFPSDHYVSDDYAFMRHVELAVRAVEAWPGRLVLLGATPSAPEGGYGWIEGSAHPKVAYGGSKVHEVRQFWEKPSLDEARRLLALEHIWWNTFVMIAKLATFLEMFVRALPEVYLAFIQATSQFRVRLDTGPAERLYQKLQSTNFSDQVLARFPNQLAVLPLNGVEWTDLGEPSRVLALFEQNGIQPDWQHDDKSVRQSNGIDVWKD